MALAVALAHLASNRDFLQTLATHIQVGNPLDKAKQLADATMKVCESARRRFCCVHGAQGNRQLRLYFRSL